MKIPAFTKHGHIRSLRHSFYTEDLDYLQRYELPRWPSSDFPFPLPLQRCSNFNLTRRTEYQKRGIRRIFIGRRNSTSYLRGEAALCKICPESKRGKGGCSLALSHIFSEIGISLRASHGFYKLNIKSLLSLCCYYTVTPTILKVHIW